MSPLGIDWRAAGVAAVVVAVTALAFGLLPAFQSSRFDPLPVLRSGGRIAHRRSPPRLRFSACSSSASWRSASCSWSRRMLFARSLYNITATDVGFNPNGLQIVGFGDPIINRLSLAERHAFQQVLIETVGSIPGVQSAGAVSQVPLSGASWNQAFHLRGNPERLSAKFTYVSPGYFQHAPGAHSLGPRIRCDRSGAVEAGGDRQRGLRAAFPRRARRMPPSSRRRTEPNYPRNGL